MSSTSFSRTVPPQQSLQGDRSSSDITSTTTADTANIPSTYHKYVDLTQRVLNSCRQSLDTKELIHMAYGKDTAIFGGSNMLESILDGLLDKISQEMVLQEFEEYCCHNNDKSYDNSNDCCNSSLATPKERLDRIDQVIQFVTEWEARRDQMESIDSRSAQESLDATLLPEGVSTNDVVLYREHLQRLQARDALQLEVEKVEQEVAALQEEQAQKKAKIIEQLGMVQQVERQVEEAANACAMVSN